MPEEENYPYPTQKVKYGEIQKKYIDMYNHAVERFNEYDHIQYTKIRLN